MMKRGCVALACLLISVPAVAQQLPGPGTPQHVICDSGCAGGGGTGGTVDQGAPGTTSDALAWPFKIVFGDVQIDPRDISDRVGRSLGKVTFDGTQDVNLTNASVAVTGTFWQATQPVSGTFFQATQPVSGTFWQATQPVSGTFFQATQPVSLTTLPALVAGSAVIGHVVVDTAPTTAVTGTFFQATQPVSLTTLPALVAGSAVIGHVIVDTAPSTAVTNTGTFAVQASQATGTNLHTVVDSGSVTAAATLAAETTKVIGTVNIAASQTVGLGSGSAVIGHVIADAGSTTAVTQGTGTNLHTVVDSGSITAAATLAAETTKVIGTVNVSSGQTIGLAAGSAVIGHVITDSGSIAQNNPVTDSANALTDAVKLTVTSSVNVKASAGNVYGVQANNGAAAVCWVQFINSATAGTLGTAVVFSVVMPTSGTVAIPPGAMALGAFSSGIAVGIASATNSSSACGTAGNVVVFYK